MQKGAAHAGYGTQAKSAEHTCLTFAGEIEAFLGRLEINCKEMLTSTGSNDVFGFGKKNVDDNLRSILLATTMQGMDGRFSCSSAYHFDKLV